MNSNLMSTMHDAPQFPEKYGLETAKVGPDCCGRDLRAHIECSPVETPIDTTELDSSVSLEYKAATMVQKVYRSYRTRCRLADSAVTNNFWWHALDYALLSNSTTSFFENQKQETAVKRLKRTQFNASKVGKGLAIDDKALKLAFQHWIEAIDPRHRYGHNLQFYYEEWCKNQADQPFFYWLDVGAGRNVDLKECTRSKLRQQCIKYLGPLEQQQYEYEPMDGKFVHKQSGKLLDTTTECDEAKWIFVMSTSRRLYAGQKIKGKFHHSSFLAGGATVIAGRLIAEHGVLKRVWPYSGHYRPTKENHDNFLDFLRESGIPLSCKDSNEDNNQTQEQDNTAASHIYETSHIIMRKDSYGRTLPGNVHMPSVNIEKEVIIEGSS